MWFIRYRVKLSDFGSEEFREESGIVFAENLGDAAKILENNYKDELFSIIRLEYITDGPLIFGLPDHIIDEIDTLHV